MRLAVAALVLVTLAAAPAASSRAAAATELRITVWPEGRGGASRLSTLRCGPVGGTLPQRARACSRLATMDAPFAPVPADVICTQIVGGPEQALVRGTFRGRKIWTRFDQRDGCRIERWNRHAFLFRRA